MFVDEFNIGMFDKTEVTDTIFSSLMAFGLSASSQLTLSKSSRNIRIFSELHLLYLC